MKLLKNLLKQPIGKRKKFFLEKFNEVFGFRPDGNQSNLRNAAYEALMEMIRHSPKVRKTNSFKSF
jgi:hypothetical protein